MNSHSGNTNQSVRGQEDNSSRHGLTRLDSFVQLFCLFQGPCFFWFPGFFKNVGIIPGIVLGCSVTIIYLYFISMYFWSERQLKKYDPSVEMVSLYSLVELVFTRIGKLPRLGLFLKLYLQYEIILSWCLGMSICMLFICENSKLILHNYGIETSENSVLLYLALPLIIVCFVPNLKTLNKAYYLSTFFIGVIIVETYFYLFSDKLSLKKISYFGTLDAIPTYVNNIFFSIVMTPLLFLYKNEMKQEREFTSILGSFNVATGLTIVLSLIYSISCSMVFGENVKENIIENLPNNSLINISNIIMMITMILNVAVLFYGTFSCLWDHLLEETFQNRRHTKFYEFVTKITTYFFVIGMTAIAPSLGSFINLVACFSGPYDIITLPVALETIIVWRLSENPSKKVFILFKNCIIIVFALVFAVSSFIDAVENF